MASSRLAGTAGRLERPGSSSYGPWSCSMASPYGMTSAVRARRPVLAARQRDSAAGASRVS